MQRFQQLKQAQPSAIIDPPAPSTTKPVKRPANVVKFNMKAARSKKVKATPSIHDEEEAEESTPIPTPC
jgi:hypothetical protein